MAYEQIDVGAVVDADARGRPIQQTVADPAVGELADGTRQVIGIVNEVLDGGAALYAIDGCVDTYRRDLVVGTVYYAAAAGTITAVAGAAAQRLGPARSPRAIQLDLEYLRGVVVAANLPFETSAADDGSVIVLDSTASGGLDKSPVSSLTAATEIAAGVVELATAGEVQAGTATDRAVTPAGLAAKVIAEHRVVTFDGGPGIIAANTYVDLYFPYAATITGWSLMAPAAAATCAIGLWSDTWAHYKAGDVPAVGDKITGTAYPALTADRGQDQTDIAMTGWTLAIAAGTVIRVNLDANTDATRLEFWLRYTRAVA